MFGASPGPRLSGEMGRLNVISAIWISSPALNMTGSFGPTGGVMSPALLGARFGLRNRTLLT